MTRETWSGGLLLALVFTLLGCGGVQTVEKTDPVSLLVAGRYADARSAAQSGTDDELSDRAVVALSYLAEGVEPDAAERAVGALVEGGNAITWAAAADQMLTLVSRLPADVPEGIALTAVEVALAAAGKGPLARVQAGPVPGSEVARSLAASVLERLHSWLANSETVADAQRLLDAWNGSYSLLSGSMATGDNDFLAWKLYSAIAGLAVTLDAAARDSDLTKVVLRSAVEVVEQNPEITTAVRCDLASPFAGLRAALTYDRDLAGRLERSVASAEGCNRGKFAPREPK
ncbi:MAG: hypothetical protein JRF63_04475 [Deltaproteobacteria bacterium]|nr:hypothetical protein [Deltaproteobacteria bacterium]